MNNTLLRKLSHSVNLGEHMPAANNRLQYTQRGNDIAAHPVLILQFVKAPHISSILWQQAAMQKNVMYQECKAISIRQAKQST